jgi:membrane protease YdiL (CAAX protease family)
MCFIVIGAIISALFGAVLLTIFPKDNPTDDVNVLRAIQLISSLLTFLLPSFLMAFTCGDSVRRYLRIKKTPNLRVIALLAASVIFITPFSTLVGYFNKTIVLPDFLSNVQEWMEIQERNAETITLKLLEPNGFISVISNIIVIALGAAVSEELLFRATFFRLGERLTKNKTLIIWISAVIFSAIHMQFFGFVPRLLLGAYFGYLLIWSDNIWLPITAHFCNNAIAVLLMSSESLRDSEFVTGDLTPESIIPFTAISLIGLCLFVVCVKSIKRRLT